jgi:hypothetical protein
MPNMPNFTVVFSQPWRYTRFIAASRYECGAHNHDTRHLVLLRGVTVCPPRQVCRKQQEHEGVAVQCENKVLDVEPPAPDIDEFQQQREERQQEEHALWSALYGSGKQPAPKVIRAHIAQRQALSYQVLRESRVTLIGRQALLLRVILLGRCARVDPAAVDSERVAHHRRRRLVLRSNVKVHWQRVCLLRQEVEHQSTGVQIHPERRQITDPSPLEVLLAEQARPEEQAAGRADQP